MLFVFRATPTACHHQFGFNQTCKFNFFGQKIFLLYAVVDSLSDALPFN
jgi:hypothetical protein